MGRDKVTPTTHPHHSPPPFTLTNRCHHAAEHAPNNHTALGQKHDSPNHQVDNSFEPVGKNKYQVNRRIQHRRRKRAKRAAMLAAEAAAVAAQTGGGVEGQGTAAETASHTASKLLAGQSASPPNPVGQTHQMMDRVGFPFPQANESVPQPQTKRPQSPRSR